jgi:hypothetical protein
MSGRRRGRTEMTYREVFFAANGFGPWKCCECGRLVERSDLDVHHVDGNRVNNDPSNLVAVHALCHLGITRRNITVESRARMSDTMRGRSGMVWSDVQRAKLSNTLQGHDVSGETREKISKSVQSLWLDPGYRTRCQMTSEVARRGWSSRRNREVSL